jgi:hypothetical protein
VQAVSGFKIAAELIPQALALLFHNGRNSRDKQGAFGVCQVDDLIMGQWSLPRDLIDGKQGL